MRVLVDTNIVLDVLLARRSFVRAAAEILAMVEKSRIEGFLCATTVTTVDCLLKRALPAAEARRAIERLLALFEVAPVNRPVLEQALRSGIADYEDAVLEQSARLVGADAIVTRNVKDFGKSSITVLDPAELISTVKSLESTQPAAGRAQT